MNDQQYSIEAQVIIKAIGQICQGHPNTSSDQISKLFDSLSVKLHQYIEDNKKKEVMK